MRRSLRRLAAVGALAPEAGFLAGHQPGQVVPVAEEGNERIRGGRQRNPVVVVGVVIHNGEEDEHDQLKRQGRHRHNAEDEQDQQGGNAGKQEDFPVDDQDDAERCSNSLAAPEMHVKRVVVPEDDKDAADELDEHRQGRGSAEALRP